MKPGLVLSAVPLRQWWLKKKKETDFHRLAVSFWSCLSFIGMGVVLLVFAPTLLDIAHQLNVGVGLMSLMFLARAIGGVLGTVGCGAIMDRLPQLHYSLLCLALAGLATANSLVPVSPHIAALAVIMFLIGVTVGGVDNGVHVILMELWGDKSGPCMQFLHSAFAVGAFLAPLIAKPFITDISDNDDLNTSLMFNFSCVDASKEWLNCTQVSAIECACLDLLTETCNTTSHTVINFYYDVISNESNCSVIEEQGPISLQYGWTYWISASFFIPPLVAFIYFAVRYDSSHCLFFKTKASKEGTVVNESSEETSSEVLLRESDVNVGNSKSTRVSGMLKTYKYPALSIIFLFMVVYVGSEVSYGSLLFTYTVKSRVYFDKQTAANVTAVFWGMFTISRVFSIVLALLKVRASVMMTLNVTGSVTAILILVFFPHNNIAVWITSALLGASFASIYPTAMTWMSEHLPMSSKATSVVIAGGNIGDIAIPSAIAALIGNVDPDTFVYSVLVLIVLSAVLLVLLFLMTAVYQKRHESGVSTVTYNRLQFTSNEDGELNHESVEPDGSIESTMV